jgi:hypothetical protein
MAAEVATHGPYGGSHAVAVTLSPSPTSSAYQFYKGFPYLIAECAIVSMVGTTGAF